MKELTIADVLNQSWGGPEFPSYEGRLDGEGVMDADARTDAAMTMFGSDADPAAASGNQDPAAGEKDPAAAAAGGDPAADGTQDPAAPPADGQLTDEQLNADPRFQELSGFKDSIVNALSEYPGLVDDKGNVNVQEAGLQLKDASVLYDIMQGKGIPSALLEIMAKNAGWNDQQKQLIANDLIGWLTKSGYLKDGQAAAGKDGKAAGFQDPIAERLDKIENDRKTEQQRAEQQRIATHQKDVFDNKFLPEVQRLCKQKHIPQEDFMQYVEGIAATIKGNKAILSRIEAGNYVDVVKAFTSIYNKEVQRLQRWTKAQTAAADKKNRNPKIPAGGAPPNPAGSAKSVNVRDRDSRIAAASELL